MAIVAFNKALYRCAQVLETTLTGIGPREELFRAGEHILGLLKTYAPAYYPGKEDRLLNSVRAVNDAIVVVWLLQYIAYFGQVKGEGAAKRKVALFGEGPDYNPQAPKLVDHRDENGRLVKNDDGKNQKEFAPGVQFREYLDRNRVDKTAFQYDFQFRPLRALTNVFFLIACVQTAIELFVKLCIPVSVRMGVNKYFGEVVVKRALFVWSKATSLIVVVAYGALVADSIKYLLTMKEDLSKSPEKEAIKLGARSSLTIYHGLKLFGVTHKVALAAFAIFAGIMALISLNLAKFRQEWKSDHRRDIVSAVKTEAEKQAAQRAAAAAGIV